MRLYCVEEFPARVKGRLVLRQAVRNLEIKARIADLAAARRVAERVATKRLGVQQQVDTYFACKRGRLKLRQIDGLSAQLVWYDRPDQPGPKTSQYVLVPVSNPETLKAALSAALGVSRVVRKRREIFLVENVRIHLDEVEGLGTFLEFEAMLDQQPDQRAARKLLDRLAQEFGLENEALIQGSYGEMTPEAE